MDQERPTFERQQKSEDHRWELTDDAGVKAMRFVDTHPIDRLEHEEKITKDQAHSARLYEEIHDACEFTAKTRDSTRTWEPKGHQSDDGNEWAADAYRDICSAVGMIGERLLYRVIKAGQYPRETEIEPLRVALDACEDVLK